MAQSYTSGILTPVSAVQMPRGSGGSSARSGSGSSAKSGGESSAKSGGYSSSGSSAKNGGGYKSASAATRASHVLPNKIHNRSYWSNLGINIENEEAVNIYLGYNLKDALLRWTSPNPRWPDIEIEREFRCWKCKENRNYISFEHCRQSHLEDDFHGETTFYGLLGCFVYGNEPCCNNCYHKLVYYKRQDTRDSDQSARIRQAKSKRQRIKK